MADNTFVTPHLAGSLGAPMAEDEATPQKYPGWRYHVVLSPVVVNSEEEEAALPAGYEARFISEEERADAAAKAADAPEEGSPTRTRSHR